ncbi:cytidine deaminase [[Mycoplasma] mobile]|uniref:Cytidine deaminase n=1 Tax=Mycoplasma mobile (strain ATCC 43663 / 163K / NCTC 11711) TaxID=267748 RepID=Q6KHU5_MYCM1|nr:cytidine deaminase [[Mycoplasma] mobile]AAT27833.1 cytidine deaminase [Mycoplasma mobile 163K]
MENKYGDIFKKLKNHLDKAYARYSNFHVAAIVEKNNKQYFGFNIENSSYPAGICAERSALFAFANDHDWSFNKNHKIDAIYIISNLNDYIVPCGMCLQVMSEFLTNETPVISFSINKKVKEFKFKELNPYPVRSEFLFEQKN